MLLASNSTISFSRNETSLGQNNCSYSVFVDSTAERISKLFAYCFILLGSFLGNISIIIIVYRHRYLRRTVNYFIVNMAVSDLLFPLSVIPVEITQIITTSWHWHVWNLRLDFLRVLLFYALFFHPCFYSKLGVDSSG